jgi:oxygen-dependent protoporphyrinogen oxidase
MRVLILGGGISGLSSAWFILKKYPEAEVTLLEKEPRLGGCIDTKQQGNFLFEMGPRTFQRSRCPELLALIADVGLEKDLVFSDPTSSARYLWVRGKLRTVASLWPHLAAAVIRDLVAPRGTAQEESIYEFASRRFGKKAAELFFDPLVKGVFGGDMRKLSLSACFPSLHEWEKTARSIVLGACAKKSFKQPSGLFTLRGGMHRLVQALCKTGMEIHKGCVVEAIRSDGVLAGGRLWTADLIISALPGSEIAKLCGIDFALRSESLTVVNLGYEGRGALKGYGYLVPSSEGEGLLGQIWDSSLFPEGPQMKMTSMVRSLDPERTALEAMRRHLEEFRMPSAIYQKTAWIPQYDVGHVAKIEQFETAVRCRFPNLQLVGNYLSGPSVEACITRTKSVVCN